MAVIRIERDKSSGSHFPIAKTDGLDVSVLGDNVDRKNVVVPVSSKTLTLPASEVSYVYVDWTSGEIESATTGFPTKSKPLYEITTDGSGVTGVADKRAMMRVSAHTEYVTQNTNIEDGDYNSDSGWTDVDLSGIAPEGATGILLAINVSDSGTPGATVAFKLRKPGEGTAPQKYEVYPQVSGLWVSATAPIGLVAGKFQYNAKVSGTMSYKIQLLGWLFGG